jgi:hypothetical protein
MQAAVMTATDEGVARHLAEIGVLQGWMAHNQTSSAESLAP